MISAAIQSVLFSVIPNTNVLIGDEKIATPFCVHTETENPPLLGKEGIMGYEFSVEIFLADTLPDAVQVYANNIIAATEALAGTTVDGTKFESVNYEGDQPGFDQESRLYGNVLRFTIETSNR